MDLFKFPFHADVWGTASEWVMIIVTITTAYFLYKTLKSQQEVQSTQNRLLHIELMRLREDYKPKIEYSVYDRAFSNLEPGQYARSIAIRSIGEKPARNVSVEYPKAKVIEGNAFEYNTQNLLETLKYASLHLIFKSLEDAIQTGSIGFIAFYEDLVGTKYKQQVFITVLNKNDMSIVAYEPEILN